MSITAIIASNEYQAYTKGPQDQDKVFSPEMKDGKETGNWEVTHFVGRVAESALEKWGNIAQYGCALSIHFTGKGTILNNVLSSAYGWIDATRIFTEINWALNTEKYSDDLSYTQAWADRVMHLSFFMVGALSTACALHEFRIFDLSIVSYHIGNIAAYGGLGFIGAVPAIHFFIAAGVGALVIGIIYKEVYLGWNDLKFETFWKTGIKLGGYGAEIAFRIVTLTTGSAPILLPILGITANALGYFGVFDDVKKEVINQDEFKKLTDKKHKEFKSVKDNEKLELKDVKAHPVGIINRTVEVASDIFASIKGLDLFSKLMVPVCAIVAPGHKDLMEAMKNFRLVAGARNIFGSPNIFAIKGKGLLAKIMDFATKFFVILGFTADVAKFVTKSNIANLAPYAGNLGQFSVFGILGTISFNTIKATSMAIVMSLEIVRITRKYWADVELLTEAEKKDPEKLGALYKKLLFDYGLTALKLGALVVSGGFMFYGGWVAAPIASNLIQAIAFSADFANFAFEKVIDKPQTEVWGPKENGVKAYDGTKHKKSHYNEILAMDTSNGY